jgi:thioester reductase-like protein
MNNILDKLDYWIGLLPESYLYQFLDINGAVKESYTYKSFDERTDAIAYHISKEYNLKKGDRVLLAYPPGLEMICAFFACVKMGLIPVPVYPPSSKGFKSSLYKMNFIAEDSGASAVLTDRSYFWSLKLNVTRKKISSLNFKKDYVSIIDWIVTNDYNSNPLIQFNRTPCETLFLQYTSGSTNSPKGVIVSHENIIDNCENVVDHQPIGVSWLPQYHDMGLIGYYIFFAMKGGTTYGFSPLDFIQRPALWLETISKYRGTASSAPNFAYEYCLRPGKIPTSTFENLDLSSLRFLMTAAEPVRTNIHEAFINKFSEYGLNPKSIFSAFGLAEYTLAVSNYGRTVSSFDKESLKSKKAVISINTDEDQVTNLLSCGNALGDTQIAIVDSDSYQKLQDGRVGEIWLDGTSKCTGYWNKPEMSKEIFEAEIVGQPEKKWLRTGDLGFLKNDELFVCGRVKDMIIIRGQNYYPQDIELLVEKDTKIRKGCVAAFSKVHNGQETLILVAEVKKDRELPDVVAINNLLVSFVGIPAHEIVLIEARTISKTSSGKIMRFKTRQNLDEDKLKIVKKIKLDYDTELLSSEIGAEVEEIKSFKELFNNYRLSGNEPMALGDAGFDSLKLTEFAHDLKLCLSLAGFNELSKGLDLRLLQKIAISELYELLNQLQTSSINAKFQFRIAFAKLQNEFLNIELEMMKSDATSAQIYVANEPNVQPCSEGILVTGGTGFFGPFLIKSLLEQNSDNLLVIVRGQTKEEGFIRLLAAFSLINPSDDLVKIFKRRVQVICGDLSRGQLGLSPAEWTFVSENTHTIYHNGAAVNYLFDYDAMRDSNVQGTKEIIKLSRTNGGKILNYISTTFIFGWSTKETLFESDSNEQMELLDFGYSQTKWVAERIVRNAMEEGLQARIYRPALISPSVNGEGSNFDISIRLLAFMTKYGISTLAQNQVSFTPADIAANNIVAISNINDSLNKTFHVTRDEYANMKEVTTLLGQLNHQSFKHYKLKEFVSEVVSRCDKTDLLFPLLNFLLKSIDNISNMEFKRYDNSNYVYYRDQSKWGLKDPELSEVVSGIFKFMVSKEIIEKPKTLANV